MRADLGHERLAGFDAFPGQGQLLHVVARAIDEYDFTFQSAVRLSLLGSALGPEFVTAGHSLVLSGPSGTGKTHLAVAIAYRAIQNGFDAVFTTATALIGDLSLASSGAMGNRVYRSSQIDHDGLARKRPGPVRARAVERVFTRHNPLVPRPKTLFEPQRSMTARS